ncbi:MAG: TatD family hydrolase [Oscillospiraceae bacterium]|jgi:TatD DNase family protein
MYFDTHAHYDDEAFAEDRDTLLASMPERGVSLIVNPGCNRVTSEQAIAIAEQYPFVYAAVGWHPEQAEEFDGDSIPCLRQMATHPKVVAIGEIGLDYHYGEDRDVQKAVLEQQLQLAMELDLPVIIHDREAHGNCMEIIRRYPKVRGVFHCYSGSVEMAKELIKMGWYLSFTGVITFKNARTVSEVIKTIPMDRIMIETDSPYLTPVPYRSLRNDSSYLPYMAQKISEIKALPLEEVVQITRENGIRLFGISQ